MRIPTEALEREQFYLDLIEKCSVSMNQRKADYLGLRSWYLFGNGLDSAPALYNKIYPHIDQLTSFLYSAETTRFSIVTGASVPDAEHSKIPVLTRALNDEWANSNADQVFAQATSWALCYNTTFIKHSLFNFFKSDWCVVSLLNTNTMIPRINLITVGKCTGLVNTNDFLYSLVV